MLESEPKKMKKQEKKLELQASYIHIHKVCDRKTKKMTSFQLVCSINYAASVFCIKFQNFSCTFCFCKSLTFAVMELTNTSRKIVFGKI